MQMVVHVAMADTSPANVKTPVQPRFVSVAVSMKQRLQQRQRGVSIEQAVHSLTS
jgi:hypothetical protein